MGILPMRPDWVPKSSGGASSLASRAPPDWVGKGARFRSCRPLHRKHGQDAHATSNPFQKHGAGKQGIGRESKCCRLSPYFSAPGFRNSVVDVAWASSPCRSGTTPKSLEGHVAATARAISERASERAWNGLPRVPRQRHGLDVHAGTRARSARSVFPKRCAAKYPLHERRKSFLE
jgi:hypothetical protein